AGPRGDTRGPTAARLRAIGRLAWAVGHRWLTGLWRPRQGLPRPGRMSCWRPSCMCPGRSRVLCRAGVWCGRWAMGWPGAGCWCALRRDPAKRRCWQAGPAAAGGPWRGWGWVAGATTRAGAGATRAPRWARAGRGLAGGGGRRSGRSFEGLGPALINERAADPSGDEVLLVLDDYHLVDSGPVHESVALLLENLPPGLRVVVSSRSEPPLPLARLRARGQLAELRAADLRFTGEEAAALLAETAGPGLPTVAAEALGARTEGGAAGLQLGGLSLRGHAGPAGFVAAFTGSHRFVLDYLADEVLVGQPGQVRAFLLETSVLERLSGELCDAVTGRPGSQAMLQDIERAGLFLVPLDEVRGWWRYHHLFD